MIPRLKYLLLDIESAEQPIITRNPDTAWERINKVCKAHKLPQAGLHGLRRSFASLCYHLGLSERETMELGGWSDAQTMHKIYIHLAQKDRIKASEKLTNFFTIADNNAEADK